MWRRVKRGILLVVILGPILSGIAIYLGFLEKEYSTNPEQRLLSEMKNRPVIMLGDFCHEAAMPCQSVILFLNEWIKSVQQNTSPIKRITLVLECDEEEEKELKNYIKTGERRPLCEYVALYSLENFEFYSDLRKIFNAIQEMNIRLDKTSQLVFDILGAESPFRDQALKTMSWENEGFPFFVNERDKLSSERIIDYYEKNPTKKLLVFYGGAHLNKRLADKDLYHDFPNRDSRGFFLARYLSEYFGDKNVLTAYQFPIPWDTDLCDQMVGPDPKQAKNVYWPSNAFDSALGWIGKPCYDAVIFRHEILLQPSYLGKIRSKNVVDACILRLESLEPQKGFLAKTEIGSIKSTLRNLTKQEFQSAQAWKEWWKKAGNEPNALVNQMDVVLDKFASSKDMRKTVILNYIGIYWVGTDEEKFRAKQFLVKETGHDFVDPADYLKWLRRNEFKVEY